MNAQFDITRIEIVTPRVVLREFRQADLRDFYNYAKVDGVGQMAGWMPHENIQKSQEVLKEFIKEKKVFAIYHKNDKKVIGSIGVEKYDERFSEFDRLEGRELGFILSKDYWGQGIMPEVVNAVVNYLFNAMHYDFITCCHFEDNNQSKRVQEKCGFKPLKKFVYETRMGTKENAVLNVLFNPAYKITGPELSAEGKYYERRN